MEVFMLRLVAFFALTVFCLIPTATREQGRPIPPGIREADKQTNKPLDPPLAGTPRLDTAKLKHQADELAQLSAGVPADITAITHGQLPKDLAEKLKRIEKLAKSLRNELIQ